jgi:hypothetical protein
MAQWPHAAWTLVFSDLQWSFSTLNEAIRTSRSFCLWLPEVNGARHAAPYARQRGGRISRRHFTKQRGKDRKDSRSFAFARPFARSLLWLTYDEADPRQVALIPNGAASLLGGDRC